MALMLFLLVQAVVTLFYVDEAAAACNTAQIECRNGGQCVTLETVCNSARECQDGSDEDPQICTFWKYDRVRCSNRNLFYCQGSCFGLRDICNRPTCTDVLDQRLCKLVSSKKLFLDTSMNLTTNVLSLLKNAVNTTLSKQQPECPMLYTRVGDLCLAFFSPAKVPWAEARQFCRSIYGELLYFKTLSQFSNILEYMREALLTSDYWIGGRYDLDTNAWSWANDDSSMPLGSPYWAERYSSSCVPRSPPHTDPFQGPSQALPGAPCYNYLQAPKERSQGWCSALTYEHFYYISDQMCQEAHSPLCVLD